MPPTLEQVKILADAMPRHRNLIVMLAQTGMRIGEACGLRWKYVNLQDEWVIVDNTALPPNSLGTAFTAGVYFCECFLLVTWQV